MPVCGVYVTICLSSLALGCEYNTHELNYVFFFFLAVDNLTITCPIYRDSLHLIRIATKREFGKIPIRVSGHWCSWRIPKWKKKITTALFSGSDALTSIKMISCEYNLGHTKTGLQRSWISDLLKSNSRLNNMCLTKKTKKKSVRWSIAQNKSFILRPVYSVVV